MSHSEIKQEYNSFEKSLNYDKIDNIDNQLLELKSESEFKAKICELKEKIIYYMEKYINCMKQSAKNYFHNSSSVNKISCSFEREEKPSEDKDNFDIFKENYFNKINNEEDYLYYHFCRNYDPIILGNENESRKEPEFFKTNTNLNNKLENSLLNVYDHSHFFIKKDCETEYNLNFQSHLLRNDLNIVQNEPCSNTYVPYIDDRFSEAEVKICKEFYDTIRLKYEIFKQKNIPKISHGLSNKMKLSKIIPPRANSTDSFSSKKRNKYLMCSENLKEDCIRKVKVISKYNIQENGEDPKVVANEYKVPLKSLKRWLEVGAIRKKGGGRKIKDPNMEKKLYAWYLDYHEKNNKPVTAKLIKQKALEFTERKDFHASKGWLEKYKKKYNLYISKESEVKNKEKGKI